MTAKVEYAVCSGPNRSHVSLTVEWYRLLRDASKRTTEFGAGDFWQVERHAWAGDWTPAKVTVIAEGGPDVRRAKIRAAFAAQYEAGK